MATTEIQLEENLGADHPKLQAFQKAVAAALRKRLQEADEGTVHHMLSRILNFLNICNCFFERKNCRYNANKLYWHFDSYMKVHLEKIKTNDKFHGKKIRFRRFRIREKM
jgi:hypothetical protein